MSDITARDPDIPATFAQRAMAYGVHVYTASGVVFAFLAAIELMRPVPDARMVLVWLAFAVLLDATDGPLARRLHVRTRAPRIHGRTIDDIVDYITFTFLPLLLVWRMDWLPAGGAVVIVLAMMASLFGFANTGAKFEDEGFFLGFPSYWNIYALYAGILAERAGPWPPLLLLIVLTVLTLAPVRFIYPNCVKPPWRLLILGGAAIWLLMLAAMLPAYPEVPGWLFWLSLVYPALYVALSLWLDGQKPGRALWRLRDRRPG